MSAAVQITCPKCEGAMRTYERSGVLIDQCTECRGIFLDRGELERLIDAEANPVATGGGSRAAAVPGHGAEADPRFREPSQRDDHDDVGDDGYQDRGTDARRRQTGDPRRKESRFGSILDIFGGGD